MLRFSMSNPKKENSQKNNNARFLQDILGLEGPSFKNFAVINVVVSNVGNKKKGQKNLQ